ncbi:hydroxyisourate hydrolase [Rhodococcus sp. 06-418-5]|uniref:hydroxyisourate hydrolase n=1 Tax=unclassified Rhodococcus (in: high G+C Gram-positive bacteria) TaxID=192944 RepID=UPI000B9B2028|nr:MULTISPECIES: hydroxyisourate hydrolase [unclassified Rhodococcus (in: high G+C Gram-positive bacteria)]OZC85688.1 hydroxyisourate hydrolase [Rhodococcus sp. 06-418-5]OZF34753.1 hydroxyisourate hydrolase [Rhodococcus sp. 14-2496-1d]
MSDQRSHVTAHVLDAARGVPAQGVSIVLADHHGTPVADAVTDEQGRVAALGPSELEPGVYRLTFATGAYFAAQHTECFHPEVLVTFEITASDQHYHIPLLLSPFAFTTYRGS